LHSEYAGEKILKSIQYLAVMMSKTWGSSFFDSVKLLFSVFVLCMLYNALM